MKEMKWKNDDDNWYPGLVFVFDHVLYFYSMLYESDATFAC